MIRGDRPTILGRVRASLGALLALGVLVASVLVTAPTAAAAADVGQRGPAYSGVTHPPTSDKPQSKLWWNDGSWWADMWTTGAGWSIWRLDRATRTWTDTGVRNDARPDTLGDTLWDGSHLYIASSVATVSTQSSPNPSLSVPSYLYRYSYANGTYTLDQGFPTTINTSSSETLAIDRDSTGAIWATWVEVTGGGARPTATVRMAASAPGGTSWGAPFTMPVGDATPTVDDISSVVALRGRIGVMWSDEATGTVAWATHTDGAPAADASSWQLATAMSGRNQADDHLNLKSLQTDDAGAVFAVMKTSLDLDANSGSKAQIVLLSLLPGATRFGSATVSTVSDCQTRPQLVLDRSAGLVHVYSAGPAPSVAGCAFTGSPGAIYRKTAPLTAPSFPPGRGTPVIVDGSSAKVNNVTTSKAPVTAESGTVILASNDTTKRYWFADMVGTTTTPPPPPAQSAVTAGASSRATSTAEAGTVTLARPQGVADGDVLVAQFTTDRAPSPTSVPAGWSLAVNNPLSPGGSASTFVYLRVVATASDEPASWTWGLSSPQRWSGGMTAFRGVDAALPIDAAAVGAVATSGTRTITVTGPSTSTPGAMVVGGAGLNSTSTTSSPPSGWTEAWESVGGQDAALSYQARPTAGPTGSLAWKLSRSGTGGAWALALRPAAS